MIVIGDVVGLIGGALMVASYLMRSMLPLRVVAVVACVFLVAYGALKEAIPTLALYAVMLVINARKALAVKKLVKDIETARADAPVAQWLLPHMKRREVKAGTRLWQKGDIATEMLYLHQGQLRLEEHQELLGPGAIVGEIGLFSPDARRTLSLRCDTDCVLFSLSAEGVAALYYTHPQLGFHVMKLVVARLRHDANLAQQRRDVAPAHTPSPEMAAPST